MRLLAVGLMSDGEEADAILMLGRNREGAVRTMIYNVDEGSREAIYRGGRA